MWTFVHWLFVVSLVVLFVGFPVVACLWGAWLAFRRWVR